MKPSIRPLGLFFILMMGTATAAWAQDAVNKVSRVDVKFIGPASVSEALIRDNIKLKPGVNFISGSTQDDVHALYATGQFYNIRVSIDQAPDASGVVVTYIVQVRPRITEIKFSGNVKLKESKLKKKLTSKVGEALAQVAQGKRYFSKVYREVLAAKLADPRAFDKVLSESETRLLSLLGDLRTDDEIAERLGISTQTVEKHLSNTRRKLGRFTRVDLLRYARDHGFMSRSRPAEPIRSAPGGAPPAS